MLPPLHSGWNVPSWLHGGSLHPHETRRTETRHPMAWKRRGIASEKWLLVAVRAGAASTGGTSSPGEAADVIANGQAEDLAYSLIPVQAL